MLDMYLPQAVNDSLALSLRRAATTTHATDRAQAQGSIYLEAAFAMGEELHYRVLAH